MINDKMSSAEIPWDMLETVLYGTSGIDTPRLYVSSMEDADAFMTCYGFRWDDPLDRADVLSVRDEAIEFLETQLLYDEPHLKLQFPAVVREERDIRKLLLWASQTQDLQKQKWSCTVLRLMHTFVHCGSYFQQLFSDQIREQIENRFRPHVHTLPDGSKTLGSGPSAIPLVDFQFRGSKSRHSLAMKLLQKAENVAADIFDWVGLRFITEERYDSLLVAKYLRVNNLIMFANVRPGRSRNTLIDVPRVKQDLAEIEELIREGKMAGHQRLEEIRRRVRNHPSVESGSASYNPFSSSTYNSIQFTTVQQIHVVNPYIGGLANVISNVERNPLFAGERLAKLLQRFHLEKEVRFFFPHEVQILDRESYERSRSGRASHDVYKERQRYSVKKRLFGSEVTHRTAMFDAIE